MPLTHGSLSCEMPTLNSLKIQLIMAWVGQIVEKGEVSGNLLGAATSVILFVVALVSIF